MAQPQNQPPNATSLAAKGEVADPQTAQEYPLDAIEARNRFIALAKANALNRSPITENANPTSLAVDGKIDSQAVQEWCPIDPAARNRIFALATSFP